MKILALATAAATLLAGSAFAQGTGNLGAQQPIHPGLQAPSYQQGSGQRAGGPANELNTNGPMTTGTIVVPIPAEPMPPSGVIVAPGATPVLDGKGQAAGGYVGEAKRRDGIQ
ncbi:MAG: hypothetical protein ACJ8CS_06325 [Microvirga sp.]